MLLRTSVKQNHTLRQLKQKKISQEQCSKILLVKKKKWGKNRNDVKRKLK